MGRLDGKVAVVTGAGQGIGHGIAEKLAADGAAVVVTDLNETTAKETAQAIGGGAVGIQLGVTSRTSVEAMVERDCLETTLACTADRDIFGKPLASYQATQLKLGRHDARARQGHAPGVAPRATEGTPVSLVPSR